MVKAERLGEIRGFIGGLYGPDLHAKRVDALARGLVTKHPVKQVDRLMSNPAQRL